MSKHQLIIKDAAWQIAGRVISAICGFFVIKLITPYLWVLRYGDYSTILKFFAIWSALSDFGLYVLAVKKIWEDKESGKSKEELESKFWKYLWTRFFFIIVIYTIALVVAYLLPAYTANPFLIWGLPLGMMFSASFMAAGIMQLPLQIFWRMKDLSIALILARVSQFVVILLTIFVLFPKLAFYDSSGNSIINSSTITAFSLILLSVVLSAVTQMFYVWRKSKKYLNFKIKFDFGFIKKFFVWNWKYGFSYYLSSFHTLVVMLFLSVMFPSADWFEYVGLWALGLSLIEIFLIIPSALWNSMIHSVEENDGKKKKAFWNLMWLVSWIWWIVVINFLIFSENIINFISGPDYIGTSLISDPWANSILPFLGIVLLLSFIKQIFNYIFVSYNFQNKLLGINLTWVIIWTVIWLITIPKYWILWWVFTQLLLEVLFVFWAFIVAKRNNVLPKIDWYNSWMLMLVIAVFWIMWYLFIEIWIDNMFGFIGILAGFNLLLLWCSYNFLKKIAKGLWSD